MSHDQNLTGALFLLIILKMHLKDLKQNIENS